MTYGFSTMGEPGLLLGEAAALVREFRLDFVELRGLGGTLDLPLHFSSRESLPAVRQPVRVVGSSLRLVDAGPEEIADFARFAVLAERLGAPHVRVFGGGEWGRKLSEPQLRKALGAVAACRRELAAKAPHVRMILETHGSFASSAACQRLNTRLAEPLDILWDSHHTWRFSRESPRETWAALGDAVRHVHYKDSLHSPLSPQRHAYTLPGDGEFPSAELLRLLAQESFAGGLSLEWERMWHPELPPLRQALERFVEIVRPARAKA